MASLIYFFPRKTSGELLDGEIIRRGPLAAVGVDDVLADVVDTNLASVFDLSTKGPGDSSGVFLQPLNPKEPAPLRLGYFPEFQEWRQCGDDLWIGFDKEFPPTPHDLKRRNTLPGYPFLSEACEIDITVPVLRSPRGNGTLPEEWGYDAAGNFQAVVAAQYRQLWEESAEIWNVVVARVEGLSIERARGLELCLKILGINYRYGKHEQNVLHWIGSLNWKDLLSLAVDLPGVLDYQKKTNTLPPAVPSALPGAPG